MSQAYYGCDSFAVSSNNSFVTGQQSAKGTLVAVTANFAPSANAGYASVIDTNISSVAGPNMLYEVVLVSALNVPRVYTFSPSLPIAYQNGLYINASNTNSVIVDYNPMGNEPHP